MSSTPSNIRKQQERVRKREAWLIPVQEWIHRDDAEKLRKYAALLRKNREAMTKAKCKDETK